MRMYLILTIVMMTACHDCPKRTISLSGGKPNEAIANVRLALSPYLLPNRDSITDENTFVFYKEQRWDTSFVLILKKDSNIIAGVYHELSPKNMETGILIDVVPFDGLMFTIDDSTWSKVVDESKKMLDSANHTRYTECVDCGRYILSHAGKYTISGRDRALFKEYEIFLRRSLIYPINRRRKIMKPI